LLAPALTALAVASCVGLGLAPVAHADMPVALSLSGYHQMAVDNADGLVFISEGSGKGIAVVKTDGTLVTVLDSSDVIEGLALSGGTLYAADVSQDAIAVVDAATHTQTATWPLGAGDVPYSVAVQSGKLWVSYGGTTHGVIGDFGLSAGTFEAIGTASTYSWYYTPELVSDPSDTGVLVASDEGLSPATVGTYNTTADPATSVAGPTGMASTSDWCSNGQQAAVIPGGAKFALACGYPYEGLVLATNSLPAPASILPAQAYPSSVAAASDGSVVFGTSNGTTQDVYVYGPDGTQRNVIPVPNLLSQGLAWGADTSTLYAISGSGGSYALHVIASPEAGQTTLTLGGATTATVGYPVSLAGQLSYTSGAAAAGDTVTISRLGPDGTTTALASAKTDSNGAFTVTDVPQAVGSYTYTASYAGNSSIPASQATATVTAALNKATVTLSGAASIPLPPGTALAFNGTLSFATGTPPAGTSVAISRANPDGSSTQLTTVQTIAGGAFYFNDAPVALGTYTYTASYAGDSATTPAQGTMNLTVALATAKVTFTMPKTAIPLKAYSVTGSLDFSFGAPATGTPLTVTRKNPNGTTTKITGVVTTDAKGDFSFSQPAESVLGSSYAYTVSYPGNATTAPVTATATVVIAKGAAPVKVTTNVPTALYGSTIQVTVHLGSTYSNRTVSVYAELLPSRTQTLLKTAKVNSAGNLVISYPGATRNVRFNATFSGDAQYAAGSAGATVGVAARVTMANGGWYTSTTSGGVTYRVYHGSGHVNFTIGVTPNKHGEEAELVVQQWVNNGWVPNQIFPFTLSSTSSVVGYLTVNQAVGATFRIRAVFVPGTWDQTNISYYSGWFYLQVTS
jgi:hypothetical protein